MTPYLRGQVVLIVIPTPEEVCRRQLLGIAYHDKLLATRDGPDGVPNRNL